MLRAYTVRLLSITFLFALDSSSAKADYDSENLGRSLRQSLSTVRRTEKAEVEYLRRSTQGRSAAQTRFNEFQNQGQGIRPEGTVATRTIDVSVENRELQQVIASEFGGAVAKLSATGDLSEISKVESRYQSSGVNPNALTRLIPKEVFTGEAPSTEPVPTGADGRPAHPAETPATSDPLSQFKTAASKAVESVNAQLAAEAKLSPLPEISKAQEEARQKLQQDQQKLAQDQAAADRAAAAGGGGGGKGGGGQGGGGNGGGGEGPKAPKLADGGKALAPEFDPSKIQAPKESIDISQGVANQGDANSTRNDLNINPMTMSNNAPRNPASIMGDTNEVPKGLQLGGPKSTPQSLTMGAGGPVPPTNAAGGPAAPGGTPAMGSGGGAGGGVSGDPYASNGIEKPYKAVNYNLSKDAGYAKGGGEGGGGDGDGAGEGTVDGGAAEAKENYANMTRPGQYLPRPTEANNNGGYPGIFSYRLYLVKMCALGEAKAKVPLCRREFSYQTAKAAPSEPASYIAAVNKETK